jgi:hypothetical protein
MTKTQTIGRVRNVATALAAAVLLSGCALGSQMSGGSVSTNMTETQDKRLRVYSINTIPDGEGNTHSGTLIYDRKLDQWIVKYMSNGQLMTKTISEAVAGSLLPAAAGAVGNVLSAKEYNEGKCGSNCVGTYVNAVTSSQSSAQQSATSNTGGFQPSQ